MLVFINSSLGIYCLKIIIFRNLLLNYIHNIFIHKYVHVNILYNYNIDNKCDYILQIIIITLIIVSLHVIVYRRDRQL